MSNCGGDCQCGEGSEAFSVEALEASLMAHALEACERAHIRLGGPLTQDNLEAFLADDLCVRFPTTIVYTEDGLSPHQFAEPVIVDDDAQKTCRLHVRPCYAAHPAALPLFVAYMAPVINYGPIVTPEICEAYGARLLGMDEESYYEGLCAVVPADTPAH